MSTVVIQLREGTIGRTLRVLRGSEVASESIGISPAKARIAAFTISAFIAGLGGAMLSIHQENVNYSNNFAPATALFWLVLVVSLALAGVGVSLFPPVVLNGTFLGWILRSEDRIPWPFPVSPKWRFILFGLGAIQYARHPEGMLEFGKRRSFAKLDARLFEKYPNAGRGRLRQGQSQESEGPGDDGGNSRDGGPGGDEGRSREHGPSGESPTEAES